MPPPDLVLDDGVPAGFVAEEDLAEAVNGPMIRLWCEMVQDANPLYHDPEVARRHGHADVVAPPAMLMAWMFEPTWRPGVGVADRPHVRDMPEVPGHPHAAVLEITQTYHRLLELGERPQLRSYTVEPREFESRRVNGVVLRQVRVLVGSDGDEVARQDGSILRFAERTSATPRPVPETPADDPARPEAPRVGAVLAPLTFPLPLKQFVLAVAATRDFYEIHHDDEYARSAGADAMLIGTHFIQGLVGRYVTDWSGPGGELRRLKLVPSGLSHPGDDLTLDGTVTGVQVTSAETIVELTVVCANGRGLTHTATVDVRLDQAGARP